MKTDITIITVWSFAFETLLTTTPFMYLLGSGELVKLDRTSSTQITDGNHIGMVAESQDRTMNWCASDDADCIDVELIPHMNSSSMDYLLSSVAG